MSWRCWWVWSWRIDGRFRRDASALVAKVSNIAGSGEFHREFETRSFTNRELKKLAARPGDLFVVKSSGSKKNILSGKTAIVAEGSPVPLIASNFLLLLRPKPELVEPHYLWRVLNSSQSKAFIKTIVGAFTYPNLKWSTYRKHPIPLPPWPSRSGLRGSWMRRTPCVPSDASHSTSSTRCSKPPSSTCSGIR